MKTTKRNSAFTLIELVTALAIVLISVSVAIIGYRSWRAHEQNNTSNAQYRSQHAAPPPRQAPAQPAVIVLKHDKLWLQSHLTQHADCRQCHAQSN